MRGVSNTIAFLLALAGLAFAQGETTVETTTEQPGQATVTTTITRDPCGPISNRVDAERCEASLTTTRVIYVRVGTKQTLRFDRPIAVIELNDDRSDRSIDIVPGESNTTAIIEAMGPGSIDAFFIGPGLQNRKGAGAVRELLMAVTIVATTQPGTVTPHNVRIFGGGASRNLRDGAQYKCTSFSCESPEKWGPGR